MKNKFTILYVDDEESNLNIFKNTFRREYNVLVASSAKEGLDLLKKEKIDLILTDQRMPEIDGVEFLKQALNNYPNLNRILITAYSDFDALRHAINEAQIFQYIQKPWSEQKLRQVIEQALELYIVKQENERLTQELTEKNAELDKINNELLELEKLKSEFLATISHEIRTPLNGLKGPLGLLKEEVSSANPEKMEVLFYILEKSVYRLEQFALSAERITQLKARKYKLNIEILQFEPVLKHALTILENKIEEQNIKIDFDLDKYAVFYGDGELIKVCIKDVLENAITYSPKSGTVMIKTYRQDDWVVIEFCDQGKGFSDKVLRHIFKPFNIGDDYIDQNIGLDLALVKLIVDAHQGEIEVCNNKACGAIVRLFFRYSLATAHTLN